MALHPSIHPSLSQCGYSAVVFWTKRHLVKSLQTNENDSPARSHSAPAALLALPLPTDIMLCCQLPVWLSDSFSLSPCFFPTAPHDTHDTRTKSVGRLATHEHGRKVICVRPAYPCRSMAATAADMETKCRTKPHTHATGQSGKSHAGIKAQAPMISAG